MDPHYAYDCLRESTILGIVTEEAAELARRSDRLRERSGEVLAISRRLRSRCAEISKHVSVIRRIAASCEHPRK